MFSATYSLSLTLLSSSDVLCSSLKHPLHLRISIRVMVRLLCVIRLQKISITTTKTIVAFGPRSRGGERSLIMDFKERCWSRLCFRCLHAKVASDLAQVVLVSGAGVMAGGELLGLQDTFPRMGRQKLQVPESQVKIVTIDWHRSPPAVSSRVRWCFCVSQNLQMTTRRYRNRSYHKNNSRRWTTKCSL